jgi:hypothetical protein
MFVYKPVLVSIAVGLLSLTTIHKAARADEWKPSLIIMPSIDHLEAGIPCDGVDAQKKRIYLGEWGKPPYVLIGEEADISPRWSGMTGRSILIKLKNGNEVYIDKACINPNPLFHYQRNGN